MTKRGTRQPIAERLDRWTDKSAGPDGCWPWTGGHLKSGYGIIGINGRSMTAHRVAYEMVYGPIAPGLYVCHRCDNPPCVNVAHLFVGPPKANVQDARSKGRTRGGAKNPLRGSQIKQAKMTEERVLEMRRLRSQGASYDDLRDRFEVAYSTVERICRGTDWKHLETINSQEARRVAHELRRSVGVHPNSRLTLEEVRQIRSEPGLPLHTLAERFGVSVQTVANVRNGKTWVKVV